MLRHDFSPRNGQAETSFSRHGPGSEAAVASSTSKAKMVTVLPRHPTDPSDSGKGSMRITSVKSEVTPRHGGQGQRRRIVIRRSNTHTPMTDTPSPALVTRGSSDVSRLVENSKNKKFQIERQFDGKTVLAGLRLTRLKILPVLTREHYTSLLHWV
jgi:hypothetical protein